MAKNLYPMLPEGNFEEMDKYTMAILHHDAGRTKARLKAAIRLVDSLLESGKSGHSRRMQTLCNLLPVYLKKKLFDYKPSTGLITPMRRMIARFEPIPHRSFLGR